MLNPNGDGAKRSIDGMDRTKRTVRRSKVPVAVSVAPEPIQALAVVEPLTPPLMTPLSNDFVSDRRVKQRSTPRRRRLFVTLGILTPLVAILAVGGWVFWPRGTSHKLSALNIATSVIKSSVGATTKLKGQSDGRTNFLIYGMTKDGLRTDSIMLASYYWQQKKLVTLNIPRDLQINDGFETAKFGEMYAYAYMRDKKDTTYPSQFVADQVAKEYGINVDYWVKFNMQGEVDLVNTLGGVDINVPDAFTDYEYPTWNYTGYIRPAPSFQVGEQHMNGDTALIYSRSRHSLDNGEGSDFARSKRQMIVLSAVLTKVKSLGIVGNLGDISHYLTILGDNVDTNMSTDEMVAFAPVAKGLDPNADVVKGNWSTENGFLCSSTSSIGAYITLYGVIGNCTTSAGTTSDSKYRELAIYYVQHLIDSAPMAATDFITSAGPNLPEPYTATTNTTASTSNGTPSSKVLSATTSQNSDTNQ